MRCRYVRFCEVFSEGDEAVGLWSAPMADDFTWARHFPPDCPPPASRSSDGKRVYRFVREDPPSEWDVMPHYERGKADGCEARGLSVFCSMADIRRARRISRAFRKHRVASGTVPTGEGRIKSTPSRTHSGHHTLWLKRDGWRRAAAWLSVDEDDSQ